MDGKPQNRAQLPTPEIWPDWGSEGRNDKRIGRGKLWKGLGVWEHKVKLWLGQEHTVRWLLQLLSVFLITGGPRLFLPAALPAALSRASPLPCQQREEVATSPKAGTVWRDFLGPESGAM